ncbi:MAG: D-arabinono,4-lactone oxidase, partial [Pseudomonadota bacterium]
MALIVKKWALEAGFDPAPLSRHSLRAGLATAAAKAGKSERSIMKQTGNRSASVDPALHPRCRAGRRQRGGWHSHPATERLVESFEYAVSAERAVAFVSRLCEIVRELRRGPDALIVNANLRFTRRSRALLAMQQFDRTCHIEIYTLRGIAGNRAFHDRMFDLAREFQALPHWGQVHDPALDAGALFGGNLATW